MGRLTNIQAGLVLELRILEGQHLILTRDDMLGTLRPQSELLIAYKRSIGNGDLQLLHSTSSLLGLLLLLL